VSTVAIPLLTVENYRILPETGPRYQLIEGDLYIAPAPNRYHQDISRNLEYILLEYLEEHPIAFSTTLHSMFTSMIAMSSNPTSWSSSTRTFPS